jgi:Fe-S cluster assembly ATP-binding protein
MVIITHYPRLLELVRPDQVHVLREGRIVRSGDHRLAEQIERDGYGTSVGAAR